MSTPPRTFTANYTPIPLLKRYRKGVSGDSGVSGVLRVSNNYDAYQATISLEFSFLPKSLLASMNFLDVIFFQSFTVAISS